MAHNPPRKHKCAQGRRRLRISASRRAPPEDPPRQVDPAAVAAPPSSLRKLVREYNDLPVLRDLSLDLEPGATLAVLGPNGAGKTTLLRILATLLRPTAGTVTVLGAEIPRERWKVRGKIGYLGHEPMLYRDLTVSENLLLAAQLFRLRDSTDRIASLLEAAGMERSAGQRVHELSAGMAQRAAACRAVLHEPELLLLDEPVSHLDPEGAESVGRLLGPQEGRTRVVVSHDVEASLAAADRVLVLGPGGTVAFEGPASELSPGAARAAYGGRA